MDNFDQIEAALAELSTSFQHDNDTDQQQEVGVEYSATESKFCFFYSFYTAILVPVHYLDLNNHCII